MNLEAKFDFWIKERLNVLICGRHGVGKTTLIKEAFEKHKLKWMYFSAATMDPWIDFIGVPKEKTENGVTYLDLVRPKCFQNDEIEALFFDEFNRSHKKVRNAVMELIQFKSINGKKFNNLKIVWAAINPDDDEEELKYDVEKLDPALIDRFHIKINMPYKPNYSYFREKYGEVIAEASVNWWKNLDKNVKNLISPRRLDYALEIYEKKGDLRDVLSAKCNVSKLIKDIQRGSVEKRLKNVFEEKNTKKATEFMTDENNFNESIKILANRTELREFFMPLLSEEQIASLVQGFGVSSNVFADYALENINIEKFENVLKSIRGANPRNTKIQNTIGKALDRLEKERVIERHRLRNNDSQDSIPDDNLEKCATFYKMVEDLKTRSFDTTIERVGALSQIINHNISQMSIADAKDILDVIEKIISRSHKKTIKQQDPQDLLVKVVNICLKRIKKNKEEIHHQNIFDYFRYNKKFIYWNKKTASTTKDNSDSLGIYGKKGIYSERVKSKSKEDYIEDIFEEFDERKKSKTKNLWTKKQLDLSKKEELDSFQNSFNNSKWNYSQHPQ